jgi:triosephosphate isomerase
MRHIIAGNWKMNGKFSDIAPFVAALLKAEPHAELIICPPFPMLQSFAAVLPAETGSIGGQDCHANEAGAHTGDVAASLLVEAGAKYVILGHSERRTDHGETNADVAGKVLAALKAGLIPIVCVGETGPERDAGEEEHVVHMQLTHSLPDHFAGLIAYEPVWAIGTGRTPSEAEVAAMHAHIRATLVARFPADGAKTPILYGGSVKPGNAATLLALPEVGGALVGGASLFPADFLAIAASAPRG